MSIRPFIAVVDDDPSLCKALERLLRSSRMEVETYPSGEKFLLTLEQREPDCLLLDVRMPGMTGPELHLRLVGMGRSIPVVFITAHAEDVEPDGSASVPEIVLKPFDANALLEALERAMARSKG